MTIVVDVTAENIAKGVKDDCSRCPVALAIRRALSLNVNETSDYVTVNEDEIEIRRDGRNLSIETPEVAEEFILNFDYGDPVEPFTFPLELEER